MIKKTPFSNPKILIGTANRMAGSGPARLSGSSPPPRWYISFSFLIRNWPVSARLNAVPQYLCPSDAWEYAAWRRYFSPFEVSTSSLAENVRRITFIRMKVIRKNICNRWCENEANLAVVERECTGLGFKKFHLLNWKSQSILVLKVNLIGFSVVPKLFDNHTFAKIINLVCFELFLFFHLLW